MSTSKLALEVFDSGLSCAEAVAIAGMKRLGRQSDLIPRIATGLAAGLAAPSPCAGRSRAAFWWLSAAFGRDKLGDDRDVLVSKVQSLVEGFRSRFGSDNCFALTGLDFNDPAAGGVYRQSVHAQCRGYVEYVCERLDELL